MSCGVGCRCGLDLALLWLWHRLELTAPIPPLAWEAPYAMGTALKTKKKKLTALRKTNTLVITFIWKLKNKTNVYNKTETDSQI